MNDLNVFELPVFADANIWSMWPADKLNELAEDIKENGFDHRYPITIAEVNGEWMLLDGRNRREAAKIAGIIPPVIVTDVEPKLAVHRSNNSTRTATDSQKAMAFAMAFPETSQGKRNDLLKKLTSQIAGTMKVYVSNARYVYRNHPVAEGKDHPQICYDVINGLMTLSEAFKETQIEVATREAEEALRQEKATKLMDVRNRYPDLAALVDDVVFEKYPTWDECERSAFFSRPLLEQYFGTNDVNQTGSASYSKCAQYGIGREVIAKMLEGTETRTAIEQALASLPLTARRKRGLELQAEEERRNAKYPLTVAYEEAQAIVEKQHPLGRQRGCPAGAVTA